MFGPYGLGRICSIYTFFHSVIQTHVHLVYPVFSVHKSHMSSLAQLPTTTMWLCSLWLSLSSLLPTAYCLLATTSHDARLVHLSGQLMPATHTLLLEQFFPDTPDNPHRKHFRYTLDVWAYVETMMSLGQSLAAVGPEGELLGVCLVADKVAAPDGLVTVPGPFLEGDLASPVLRQQVTPLPPPPVHSLTPGPGRAVARLVDGPSPHAAVSLAPELHPPSPAPPATPFPHPLQGARATGGSQPVRWILRKEAHGDTALNPSNTKTTGCRTD